MSLQKRKIPSLSAGELHFVVEIPLEHAINLLEALGDEDTQVIFDPISEEQVRFVIKRISQQAQVNGQLRHWEGTATRIDCGGHVIREEVEETPLSTSGAAVAILVFFAGLLINQPALSVAGIIFAILASLYASFEKNENSDTRLHFRERDRILERIIAQYQNIAPLRLVENRIPPPRIAWLERLASSSKKDNHKDNDLPSIADTMNQPEESKHKR
jgi:hypothetical protein